jgi:hypothetical protein
MAKKQRALLLIEDKFSIAHGVEMSFKVNEWIFF